MCIIDLLSQELAHNGVSMPSASPICSDRNLPHTVFRRNVRHRLGQTRWYITAAAHLCSRTSSQSWRGPLCSAVQCCTTCTRRGSNRAALSCCSCCQFTALACDVYASSCEISGLLFQPDSLQVCSMRSILWGATYLSPLHSNSLQRAM